MGIAIGPVIFLIIYRIFIKLPANHSNFLRSPESVMVDKTTAESIIRTKMHRPPVGPDFVSRPRLLERLEKHCQRPLTLVMAPAGYGKSMLMSNWLEACDCPSAWVSLDKEE